MLRQTWHSCSAMGMATPGGTGEPNFCLLAEGVMHVLAWNHPCPCLSGLHWLILASGGWSNQSLPAHLTARTPSAARSCTLPRLS